MYYSSVVYKFNPTQFLDIVKWGVENSNDVRIQKLEGHQRVSTSLTLDDYLNIYNESDFKHNVVVHRKGDDDWKTDESYSTNWCIEIASCTMIHFLFIYVDEKLLEELITKFNLEPVNQK
jgi:hypothetical protein